MSWDMTADAVIAKAELMIFRSEKYLDRKRDVALAVPRAAAKRPTHTR